MEEQTQPRGLWRMLVPVGLAVGLILCGAPEGLSPEAWHLAAVFLATILAFLLRPIGMGPVVFLALIGLAVGEQLRAVAYAIPKADRILGFKRLLGGFGDSTVWLVVAAFLLAGVMIESGLGRRIALTLIAKLGKSMLGLGYATCLSELALGPFIPSNTARGGGVMAPVVDAVSRALKSRPEEGPLRAGQYLSLVGAHANLITAAMFLTGMAANPLVRDAARDVMGVDFGWGRWALGALVPGLLGLALLPRFLLKVAPPELTDTRAAQDEARKELAELGPWTRPQKILTGVLIGLLLLWATNFLHGFGTALVAWMGVLALVLTGAVTWRALCENAGAWDALVWLGGLVSMAKLLREEKVVAWFVEQIKGGVQGFEGLPALAIVLILALVYFYSMYGFSMLTGHILAFVAAFLGLAKGFDAPPVMTVAIFAYFSNLCAAMTNYSSGPIIIYFGLGYVPAPRWFWVGFLVSLFHIVIWIGAGLLWWKALGWW